MIIMHELNQLEKGGAERVVLGIIKNDRKNSHIVYSYKDGPMRELLEAVGAKVIVENPETTENLDADIIHLHTGGDASRLANAVKGQLPTIETVHSPVASAVRDQFVLLRVGVSNQVTKLNRKCRTIYNGVDFDRLSRHPEGEAARIHNEQNPGSFMVLKSFREVHGIPADAFVVGRLGRIGTDKCLEQFLVTCKKVQDNALCQDMHVLIVGDEAAGSIGYLAKMKVAAASLPLKNVHWIPSTEFVGWAMDAMDVFLYPSPTEGFGLVFLEAMACGVPVLTWETDLTRELLLGAAALTKEKTIAALAEELIYLSLNPGIRKSLGSEGQRCAEGFTDEAMSLAYQKLYDEIYAAEFPDSHALKQATAERP